MNVGAWDVAVDEHDVVVAGRDVVDHEVAIEPAEAGRAAPAVLDHLSMLEGTSFLDAQTTVARQNHHVEGSGATVAEI